MPRHCQLWFQLLYTGTSLLPLLASDNMLCSCHLDIHQASLCPNSAHTPLCPVYVTGQLWSPLVISLSVWHQSTFHAHSPTSLRAHRPLDSLFSSLTQILFDSASLRSRRRPTVSRPRTIQPLCLNDACYHALVASNGSWRDFRRSGSQKDQARFRLLRQQFHSTIRSPRTHFWNEWLGSVTALSRPCSQACVLFHPPHLPVPCCHT